MVSPVPKSEGPGAPTPLLDWKAFGGTRGAEFTQLVSTDPGWRMVASV